jgi:alkanesulfonate monooxygenase SsuD/methylene tetrahydromethanopterin reductase-like flavin-dependent oxidoreductase (luciferase family)
MIAVSTLVADSAEEAARLVLPNGLYFSRLRSGARPGRIPTLAEAEAHEWTPIERQFVEERNAHQAIGDLEHVTARITELAESTGANEVIVVPQGPDLDSKLRTLRDLAASA